MMKAVKNNKTLFIVLASVLVIGAVLAVVLISSANAVKAEQQIQTAQDEAVEDAALSDEVSDESATPEETPPLSAEGLRRLVMNKEYRRSFLIPVPDSIVIEEADTWDSIEPEGFVELKLEALSKAKQYAKDFFGFEITDVSLNFWYYTDTSGLRSDFVKLATLDDAIVCTLTADTLELINIDYNYIPPLMMTEEKDAYYKADSDMVKTAVTRVTGAFETEADSITVEGGGGYQQEYTASIFRITTADGRFIKIGLLNGECYTVSVYPTRPCMNESVFFEADIRRDPEVMQPAAPRDFTEGEPGSDDMSKEEALEFYMTFLKLANGDGDYAEPSLTFFIDNSGARENYWQMQGEKMSMDVSSKSRWIISFSCDHLWNPDFDLTKIKYNAMGGEQYEEYIENIMGSLFGDEMVRVEPNAVYDGHFCTEIVIMADNSAYEFMFEDGKLIAVFYTFDESYIGYVTGWKADSLYINAATGEEYISY